MGKLTIKQEFEIRKFAIISIIRLLSEFNFTTSNLNMMVITSKNVRKIMDHNENISDDDIFKLYDKTTQELGEEKC